MLSGIRGTKLDKSAGPFRRALQYSVYDWTREATVEESLAFADRVQAAIQGMKTYFRIESIED